MTLSEFKAWFEGFTENIDGRPSEKQWARICKRMKDIDGSPTPYPVYIERYVEPYWRRWQSIHDVTWSSITGSASSVGMQASSAQIPDWSAVGVAEHASLA